VKRAALRRDLAVLRKRVPPMWPVVVRRRALKKRWGSCSFHRESTPHFAISLDPTLEGDFLRWTLLHEWSHALSWTSEHPSVADHGPEFGLAYARVYSALIEP